MKQKICIFLFIIFLLTISCSNPFEIEETSPRITSTPITSGIADILYNYNVKVEGHPFPKITLTTYPQGMSFNETTHTIEWLPPQAGLYDVVITASNKVGVDKQSFTITVGDLSPSITSTAKTVATADLPYAYKVEATGNPIPTYSLEIAPPNMTISEETGLISWIPPFAGSFDVLVQASNKAGIDQQNFIIEVQDLEPSITSTPIYEASVGNIYFYNVGATGNPNPTFTLLTSPAGMILDTTTNIISWTPTNFSDFKVEVTIQAQNRAGSDLQTFYIRVGGLQIEGWETSTFSAENMNQSKIDDLLSLKQAGSYAKIHSILVIKNGKLVLEEYFYGKTREWPSGPGQNIQFNRHTLHHQASITKSVVSILMGIALENNIINNLSEQPFDFFPQYSSYENWNNLKNKMTLKDLITMTAGFEWGEDGESFFSLIFPTNDWIKSSLDLPVIYLPGEHWDYFSPGPDILGAVISEASGMELSLFANQHLFNPLGITETEWYITPTGRAFGGGCHKMKPIDMAKIGFMILNGGQWQGQQIVSQSWIDESTMELNPDYGYLWWLFPVQWNHTNMESIVAAGAGGQRIYSIHDLDMVVVFTAGYYDSTLGGQYTHEIVQDYIVPSVLSN